MGSFNQAPESLSAIVENRLASHPDATTNHGGGLAFKMTPQHELVALISGGFANEKQYYEPAAETFVRLQDLVERVAAVEPEFVLKAAAYVRQEMHNRHFPVAVLALAASLPVFKGNGLLRFWTPEILRRPDEIKELIALWTTLHGDIGSEKRPTEARKAFPNGLKKGIAITLRRASAYSLLKYNGGKGRTTLGNAIRLVHPTPENPEQSAVFRFLTTEEVIPGASPMLDARKRIFAMKEPNDEVMSLIKTAGLTWENALSHFGNSAAIWNMIAPQLGFMAALRNLRNVLVAGADEAITHTIKLLTDAKEVAESKQYPFRFLSAYEVIESEIPGTNPRKAEVLEAIQTALELSTVSLPSLGESILIATDNSMSMDAPISQPKQRGKDREERPMSRKTMGNLFGAMAYRLCKRAYPMVYATDARLVELNRKDGIITNMRRMQAINVNHGTETWKIVRTLRDQKIRVDVIMVLSDMQGYGHHSVAAELAAYRREMGRPVRAIFVNLASYGTTSVPNNDPHSLFVSGWSVEMLKQVFGSVKTEEPRVTQIDSIREWVPRGMRSATPGAPEQAPTQDDDSVDADES